MELRLFKPALLLFLLFIFTVVQGQEVTKERVLGSESSTTVVSFATLDTYIYIYIYI